MEEKSASVLKSRSCGKLLAGLQSRSLTGYLLWLFFPIQNLSLSDWVNSQRLLCPFVCLGDGHDGVWNLFMKKLAALLLKILDLGISQENLARKVGGS